MAGLPGWFLSSTSEQIATTIAAGNTDVTATFGGLSDSTTLTLDPQTRWKVLGTGGSNKIIEVNGQGLVTGLGCGTAEVEANHRGVKTTMAVQVCE